MTMMLFLFVFSFLFAVVDAPYHHHDVLLEAVLEGFHELLQQLETTAGNVLPPLPPHVLAAAIVWVFFPPVLPRLAAAWGCLVRWAGSVDSRALANSRCRWILGYLAFAIVWMDGVLSPFKLEDWRDRALAAENALALALVDLDIAETALEAAERKVDIAEAGLEQIHVIQQGMRAILDSYGL
ncbi:hypothetical protein GQ44DRAFT_773883 [Phaeosphaeriaceae sp. PMI808]|nr:hypothetical protein GQ44DRAFT_773883 [Phaeosphaeriaceae sp. PMI808]